MISKTWEKVREVVLKNGWNVYDRALQINVENEDSQHERKQDFMDQPEEDEFDNGFEEDD